MPALWPHFAPNVPTQSTGILVGWPAALPETLKRVHDSPALACDTRARQGGPLGADLAERVVCGRDHLAQHQLAVDHAQRAHVLQVHVHVVGADPAVARAARLVEPGHLAPGARRMSARGRGRRSAGAPCEKRRHRQAPVREALAALRRQASVGGGAQQAGKKVLARSGPVQAQHQLKRALWRTWALFSGTSSSEASSLDSDISSSESDSPATRHTSPVRRARPARSATARAWALGAAPPLARNPRRSC